MLKACIVLATTTLAAAAADAAPAKKLDLAPHTNMTPPRAQTDSQRLQSYKPPGPAPVSQSPLNKAFDRAAKVPVLPTFRPNNSPARGAHPGYTPGLTYHRSF